MRFIDLTGQRFGRLLVIERYLNPEQPKRTFWRCRCDCGAVIVTGRQQLRSGVTKSCGCLGSENVASGRIRRTHGMSGSKEYHAWVNMRRRCQNPAFASYAFYGGRGIRVCEQWDESFEAFLADVGPAPTKRHSIDRIDVHGNYEPGNVRWVTHSEQMQNTTTNHYLTYQGETLTLAEWSRRTGIQSLTIRARIVDLGWSIEEALSALPASAHPHGSTSSTLPCCSDGDVTDSSCP